MSSSFYLDKSLNIITPKDQISAFSISINSFGIKPSVLNSGAKYKDILSFSLKFSYVILLDPI